MYGETPSMYGETPSIPGGRDRKYRPHTPAPAYTIYICLLFLKRPYKSTSSYAMLDFVT